MVKWKRKLGMCLMAAIFLGVYTLSVLAAGWVEPTVVFGVFGLIILSAWLMAQEQ